MKAEKGRTYDIWAVVKDTGGTAGVLPVVEKLRGMGYTALIIANGVSVGHLTGAGREDFLAYDSADQVVAENPLPRLLLSSMCSKGGVGMELVRMLRSTIPTVYGQDFWGSRLWSDLADPATHSDHLWVNDEVGAKIVCDAWPDFPAENIWITGYPALDRFAGYRVEAAATKARSTLGLAAEKPVVLYGGQTKRTGEVLAELVATLNGIGRDVYLVPRPHPRMKTDGAEELPKWERALADFKSGTLVADSSACDTQSLLALATVVCSMYSTILVEAATIQRQNISILYPEAGMARYYEEVGSREVVDESGAKRFIGMKEFPLVNLKCTAKATDRDELSRFLADAFGGGLGLEAAQAKTFRLDGKNAERAASRVATLLG